MKTDNEVSGVHKNHPVISKFYTAEQNIFSKWQATNAPHLYHLISMFRSIHIKPTSHPCMIPISSPYLPAQVISQAHKTSIPNSTKSQTEIPHFIFHLKKLHKLRKPIIHNHPFAAMPSNKELEVVKGLDLLRYMGRWYEIASFPSLFQPKNGINTRATYTLKEDGTVNVLNETWSDGKRVSIEGTAYKADANSDEAKLKVKFYVPPFLPIIPVVGDYWVMYIDEDYQYALIGQPSRKYLWILCRQNHMDEEIYNQLVDKAKEQGYDVSKLHKTTQTNPPPEADSTPNDTKGIWWIKSIFGK